MTLPRRYVLDEKGEPRLEPNLLVWAQWFEHASDAGLTVVANTELGPKGQHVSTVFLGFDHNFFGEGPPILYETMVFGGRESGHQRRSRTRAEALVTHEAVLALARKALS